MGSASDDNNISVWVCREEKLVLGVSKRTSCADVVQVLLEEQDTQRGLSAAQAYCIVEKWRGAERILPNKTKIWKLWLAWGDERRNVRFVLLKSDASLESRCARSAEARVVPSRQSPGASAGPAAAPVRCVSPEKQRRIVRKAFRKLEKINKKRARHRDASCAERMETLVHLVLSRDHTIRQQRQRISELDAEIEAREARVHRDRVRTHGANYVQNTYLADGSGEPRSAETSAKWDELVRRCEDVLRVQEELREQEALTEALSGRVREELERRRMLRREERGERSVEAERVNTQLEASLYIGLRLGADLEAVRSDLELSLQICAARAEEMRDLQEKVDSLGTEEPAAVTPEGGSAWVSTGDKVNDDEDSDTGLSSLHSQESDGPPVWESLV